MIDVYLIAAIWFKGNRRGYLAGVGTINLFSSTVSH
jgi:hypothetical protein